MNRGEDDLAAPTDKCTGHLRGKPCSRLSSWRPFLPVLAGIMQAPLSAKVSYTLSMQITSTHDTDCKAQEDFHCLPRTESGGVIRGAPMPYSP